MSLSYIQNLKTPVAIIGYGKSGQSAHKLLLAAGLNSEKILTFDEKSANAGIKDVNELLKNNPQTLVVSPGVPLKTAWIQQAKANGVLITSEISLAASLITTEKIIGITGSVGKSTVTSLLGAAVTSFDTNAFVGGNLGIPFCDYALKRLQGSATAEWVVLELSSYQLENCENLKLHSSIITYLSSNHLERYESLQDYYLTKFKVTEITENECLLNKTSADCVAWAEKSKCRYRLVNSSNFSKPELLSDVFLIGAHNKDNFSVAAELAIACGWPEQSLIEMMKYKGLSHRLEFVASLNNITYVNDSKATAMDSVLVAARGCLEALHAPQKLFLLLGGKDKNLPWEDLSVLTSNELITPVFFGACGELAREKSQLSGEYFTHLGSAINYCQKRAQSGDVVLLSPGGTSLDEFKNFEERGDFFKTLVLSQVEA